MSNASTQEASQESQKTIMGHPQALYILFFSELWERFSFYGMRALLILYMTKEFLIADDKAFGIYAAYMALLYATPIVGGILADRILGAKKTTLLGGVLIAIGNALMLVGFLESFFLALSFIIVGTGLFKANVSTLVGAIYEKNDPRKDAGYTIFYMGINLGGLISTLIVGYIGENYGWTYGFLIAAVGMLAGLYTFVKGEKYFGGAGDAPASSDLTQKVFGLKKEVLIYLGAVASCPLFYFMLQQNHYMNYLMGFLTATTLVLIPTLAYQSFKKGESKEAVGLLVILGLMFFHSTFWALFEQAGSSMNLFSDRNVDRNIFGLFEIKASMLQGLNPLFIMILGPLFSIFWVKSENSGMHIRTPMKFFLGILQVGLGFLVLSYSTQFADAKGLTSILWFVLAVFLHTSGELCISPVGLSMVSQLAPQRVISMMMGFWFLSVSFAHYIAGLISKMMAVPTAGGGKVDPLVSLPIYGEVFEKVGYGSLAVCVLLLVLTPLFNKAFKK